MNNSGMSLRALRGATTATANTAAAMEEAVAELIEILTHRNNLKGPRFLQQYFQ